MVVARRVPVFVVAALVAAACGEPTPPLQTAAPGVVFTYPLDAQVDVPLGTRVVVTFSDPVTASALGGCTSQGTEIEGAFCLVGPDGPLDTAAEITGDGKTVAFPAPALAPGATYALYVRPALSPTATNLPAAGPLLSFTARTARPRGAAPTLVAVNGGDPALAGDDATAFRPMFETSTIRLVFSEPLDPRAVTLGAGAIELVQGGTVVPATLLASGIHVAIDPIDDLTAGASYELRLGNRLVDLGGQPLAPTTVTLVPADSLGRGPIAQVLRTRQPTDPGPATSRAGAERNVITIDKPLIGREASVLLPSTMAAELGDPKALGGPIAFTIRRGQRLKASGLDIKLGGEIPVGLSTGDIEIELLTDGGGRLYRNPYQPPGQRPENDRAPLFVDLSLDVAVYATDPTGNAVLTQTVLGVQATGVAVGTEGVLAIEAVASMELGLLGVTQAPTNLVLELITDPTAAAPIDGTPPELIASSPALGTSDHPVDAGIALLFSEPLDLDRARAGIRLETSGGVAVASVLESHGAALVIRPLAPLAYNATYRVVIADVADRAGNLLPALTGVSFATPRLIGTGIPPTAVAVHPGVPCALTGATATSPGRCAGGDGDDDVVQPFTLAANEMVEVTFSQPMIASTMTRGAACGTGSVRIEELDGSGACTAAVAGTLLQRERSLSFIPDVPWTEGRRYRLTLVSGGDDDCDGGELCGVGGVASFDPLNGTEGGDGGGPNLVITFTGAPPSTTTFMIAEAGPHTDLNGSGYHDGGEPAYEENRAAMRIVDTTGDVDEASFDMPDCLPATPEVEACMYVQGAMPVAMGDLATDCALPDGTTAPSCVPVRLSPQAMYGTSVAMDASVGISIGTDTGTSVMRIREPADGPVTGFIIDRGGVPTMIATLELYMDAPDMSVTLSSHDLHSKPLTLALAGPVTFLPDGRIAISISNTADVPVEVTIDGPIGIDGSVKMILPAGEMKLQLVAPLVRGGAL